MDPSLHRTAPADLEARVAGSDGARLRAALAEAKRALGRPYVITIETDRYESVPSYESWWGVAPAEVSGLAQVRASRERYEKGGKAARRHLRPPE